MSSSKRERHVVSRNVKRRRGGLSGARAELRAYEFLCHQAEAKQWIEDVLGEELRLKKMSNFGDLLRDGIPMAKLAKHIMPKKRIKIVTRMRGQPLNFRHTDNLNWFLLSCKHIKFPDIYTFTIPDCFEKKNIVKVVYCIHALAHFIDVKNIPIKYGKGQKKAKIQNLVGQVEFDKDEIADTAGQLEKLEQSGASVGSFDDVAKKMQEEANAKKAADEAEQERLQQEEEERRLREEKEKEAINATKIQSWYRGSKVRKSYMKEKDDVTKVQSLWRAKKARQEFRVLQERKQHKDLIEKVAAKKIQSAFRQYLQEREEAAIKIQCAARGMMARRRVKEIRQQRYEDKLRREKELLDEVSSKLKDGTLDDPSVLVDAGLPTVQRLLLFERDNDSTDWIAELDRLKKLTIVQVRTNYALEKEVDSFDKKIELSIRNRFQLQAEFLDKKKPKQVKKKKGKGGVQSDLVKPEILTNPDVRNKYQGLMYLLQSEPKHFADIVHMLQFDEAGPFIDSMILSMFGFMFSPREEYLIVKLLTLAANNEISSNRDIRSFLKEDTVITRMIVTYTKRNQGKEAAKAILQPIVQPFLEIKDLNLEANPIKIYHGMIDEFEIKHGEKSTMDRNVSLEDALVVVRSEVAARNNSIVENCRTFLDHLIGSVDLFPYGLRYICKHIAEFAKQTFEKVDMKKEIYPVLGYFIYYRFINPYVVSPMDIISGTNLGPNDVKNLLVVSRVLQNLFNFNNPFVEEYFEAVYDFVEESYSKVYKFLEAIMDVPDPESHLNVDYYMELTQSSKPVILISTGEIYLIHSLLLKYIDNLKNAEHLTEFLKSIPNPPDPDSVDEQYSKQDIQLVLSNPFQEDREKVLQSDKSLYEKAKEDIVNLLVSLPPQPEGGSEMDIVDTMEYALDVSEKDKDVERLDLIRVVSANLVKLIKKREINGADDQRIVFDIAEGICNRRETREREKLEVEKLRETYAKVQERAKYLNSQISEYKVYLQSVFKSQIGGMTKKKKKAAAVVEKEGAEEGDTEVLFGPFKYSFSKLLKKGVIQSTTIRGPTKRALTFMITSKVVGTIEIKAMMGPAEVALHSFFMDDLLQKQEMGITSIDIDNITLNTNLLIHWINKLQLKQQGLVK